VNLATVYYLIPFPKDTFPYLFSGLHAQMHRVGKSEHDTSARGGHTLFRSNRRMHQKIWSVFGTGYNDSSLVTMRKESNGCQGRMPSKDCVRTAAGQVAPHARLCLNGDLVETLAAEIACDVPIRCVSESDRTSMRLT